MRYVVSYFALLLCTLNLSANTDKTQFENRTLKDIEYSLEDSSILRQLSKLAFQWGEISSGHERTIVGGEAAVTDILKVMEGKMSISGIHDSFILTNVQVAYEYLLNRQRVNPGKDGYNLPLNFEKFFNLYCRTFSNLLEPMGDSGHLRFMVAAKLSAEISNNFKKMISSNRDLSHLVDTYATSLRIAESYLMQYDLLRPKRLPIDQLLDIFAREYPSFRIMVFDKTFFNLVQEYQEKITDQRFMDLNESTVRNLVSYLKKRHCEYYFQGQLDRF